MNKTFIIHSFGCKVNQEEAEQLAALLITRGWREAAPDAAAGLYIVNTCTVTQVADKKARALIRRLRREHPAAVLAVTGCYAQTAAEQIAALTGVDIIAGLSERARLPELVEQRLSQKHPLTAVADITQTTDFLTIGPATRQKRTRAYLKIEDGCGQFCHYCIIPHARGPVRSLPLVQALDEARALLQAGHQELVLSGIHIGAYGEGLPPGQDLPALIEAILGLADNFRLRLGSIEPQQFGQKLLGLIAREVRLCPHLHIPLQAGCDRILLAMNRHYSTADYAALLTQLRGLRPGLAVTTDVMVGYPGETSSDFEASLSFCERMGFARMHVFPYSKRPGTVAATLCGQIPQREKARRAALLGKLAAQMAENYARGFIGAQLEYLFEQGLELWGHGWQMGHSGNYLPLLLPGGAALPAGLTPIRAVEYRDGYLLGEL